MGHMTFWAQRFKNTIKAGGGELLKGGGGILHISMSVPNASLSKNGSMATN